MRRKVFLLMAVFVLSACSGMPDMKTAKKAYKSEDYLTARTHYQELSEFGLPQAKTELGRLYLYGKGVEKNPQKALALFEEAGALGDRRALASIPVAQAGIGAQTLKNTDDPLEQSRGIAMLRQAALMGAPQAYFELGYAYERGVGVPQNGGIADSYYQKAAAKDYTRAYYYRARLYERGKLVPQDLDLAAQLYRQAAEKGYEPARTQLRKLYGKNEISAEGERFPKKTT